MKGADKLANLLRRLEDDFLVGGVGRGCPVPAIGEGFYLGFGLNPAIFLEQDVEGGVVVALSAVKDAPS